MLKKRSSKTVYKTVFVSTKKNEHLSNLLKNNYLKQSLDFVISHCFKKKKRATLLGPLPPPELCYRSINLTLLPPPKVHEVWG